VIGGFTTIVDLGKLGFTGVAVYARFGTQSQARKEKAIRELRENVRVYWLAELWGNYDLLFAIQVKGMAEFSEILGQIQKKCPDLTDAEIAVRTKVSQFQRS
jgi:hypothetical protein